MHLPPFLLEHGPFDTDARIEARDDFRTKGSVAGFATGDARAEGALRAAEHEVLHASM